MTPLKTWVWPHLVFLVIGLAFYWVLFRKNHISCSIGSEIPWIVWICDVDKFDISLVLKARLTSPSPARWKRQAPLADLLVLGCDEMFLKGACPTPQLPAMTIAEFCWTICKIVAAMKQQHRSYLSTGDNWKFTQNILSHGSYLSLCIIPGVF